MEEQLPKRGRGRPRLDDTTEYAINADNERTRRMPIVTGKHP